MSDESDSNFEKNKKFFARIFLAFFSRFFFQAIIFDSFYFFFAMDLDDEIDAIDPSLTSDGLVRNVDMLRMESLRDDTVTIYPSFTNGLNTIGLNSGRVVTNMDTATIGQGHPCILGGKWVPPPPRVVIGPHNGIDNTVVIGIRGVSFMSGPETEYTCTSRLLFVLLGFPLPIIDMIMNFHLILPDHSSVSEMTGDAVRVSALDTSTIVASHIFAKTIYCSDIIGPTNPIVKRFDRSSPPSRVDSFRTPHPVFVIYPRTPSVLMVQRANIAANSQMVVEFDDFLHCHLSIQCNHETYVMPHSKNRYEITLPESDGPVLLALSVICNEKTCVELIQWTINGYAV